MLQVLLCLQYPNAKDMQINMTGFLNAKNAQHFMAELWDLLTSAQDNISGIPARFLEQKKEEIKKRQVFRCRHVLIIPRPIWKPKVVNLGLSGTSASVSSAATGKRLSESIKHRNLKLKLSS